MLESADGYTKMVTASGEAKFYTSKIDKFDAAKWSTYSDARGKCFLHSSQRGGEKLYMFGDKAKGLTIMLKPSGKAKAYLGTIDQFNPSKWEVYRRISSSKYALKDMPLDDNHLVAAAPPPTPSPLKALVRAVATVEAEVVTASKVQTLHYMRKV